jgi:hypothetical protein
MIDAASVATIWLLLNDSRVDDVDIGDTVDRGGVAATLELDVDDLLTDDAADNDEEPKVRANDWKGRANEDRDNDGGGTVTAAADCVDWL